MLFNPSGQATHDLTWIFLFCAVAFATFFLRKVAPQRIRQLRDLFRKRLSQLKQSPQLRR